MNLQDLEIYQITYNAMIHLSLALKNAIPCFLVIMVGFGSIGNNFISYLQSNLLLLSLHFLL